jgi:hypothetical protein
MQKLPLALGGGFGYKDGFFRSIGGIEQVVEFEARHAI